MEQYHYNWEQHNNSRIQFPKKKRTIVNTVKKRFSLVISVVLLISALGVMSYIYIAHTESIPVVGGSYSEGVVGSPQFINPLLTQTNDANRDITQLTYRSLMKYDQNGELVKDMAESFEVSPDGTVYSFTLQPELQWSDSKPITANDVVFTIQLVQNPKYKSPFINNWRGVDVQTQGERTVVMRLQSAYTPFLQSATLPIAPKHKWENVSAQEFANSEPWLTQVGSGKYVIKSITQNERKAITSVVLNYNELADEPVPYIQTITFKFYASEQAMLDAYNKQLIDGISFIPLEYTDQITQNSRVYEFQLPRYFAVFFNYDSANDVIKDAQVRRALIHATNKEQILQDVLQGYGKIAHAPIPPSSTTYHNPSVQTVFSLEQANQMLDQAGWSQKDQNGVRTQDGEQLSLRLTAPNTPELTQVATTIQQQWKQVGVDLAIQFVDVAQLQQTTLPTRNYDMILYGETLGSIVDPYPFWHSSQAQHPGLNIAALNNSTVDTLLEQGRLERAEEKRVEIYKKLQEYFTDNALALFLYEPSYLYTVNSRIKGITPFIIVDPAYRFTNVEKWYIKTKRLLTI